MNMKNVSLLQQKPSDDDRLLVTLTVGELTNLVRSAIQAANLAAAPQKLLMDTKQAAALLNVPETWLAAAARENRIPVVRVGHYVRFSRADLEAFIESKSNHENRTEGSQKDV